jgi:hypothetical protein
MSGKSCPCRCSYCQAGEFNLHQGDRVVFGGNATQFSHSQLVERTRDAGIHVEGQIISATVCLITNASGGPSKTEESALAKKIPILSVEDFELALKNLTRNGRRIFSLIQIPFKNLRLNGKKVYLFDLFPDQLNFLENYVKSKSGTIAFQIRDSVTAAVCRRSGIDSPKVTLFRSKGVPVYFYEDLDL